MLLAVVLVVLITRHTGYTREVRAALLGNAHIAQKLAQRTGEILDRANQTPCWSSP